MKRITAIGFDLFNTLITAGPKALDDALTRLIHSLEESGLSVEDKAFKKAHREAAIRFIKETRRNGRETHNRFWISAALKSLGHSVPPDDTRIASAVESYFSAFLDYCHPIPGTKKMLQALKGRYRLGLLSNFTHAPAARNIIGLMGLNPFFDVIIISGDLGYCKPHPLVFRKLVEGLGVPRGQILYVGDDIELDVAGAVGAGLQPVWLTHVRDKTIPFKPDDAQGPAQVTDCHVPQVTNWKELLSLLDSPCLKIP